MPTTNPRITIMVSDDLLKKIDEYRFSHRKKNQTQAIVELINIGLEVISGREVPQEQKFTEEELHLVDLYRSTLDIFRSTTMAMLEESLKEKRDTRIPKFAGT